MPLVELLYSGKNNKSIDRNRSWNMKIWEDNLKYFGLKFNEFSEIFDWKNTVL